MRTWYARVMVACALLFVGGVQAQNDFKKVCVEGAPTGYLSCRLKPDGFTGWLYDSGMVSWSNEIGHLDRGP